MGVSRQDGVCCGGAGNVTIWQCHCWIGCITVRAICEYSLKRCVTDLVQEWKKSTCTRISIIDRMIKGYATRNYGFLRCKDSVQRTHCHEIIDEIITCGITLTRNWMNMLVL